jgi:DNA-binding response OmpR family regulator
MFLAARTSMEEKSVLVVDDGSLIRWAMVKEISTLGYVAHGATTGAAALRMLRGKRYPLVFLNIHLSDVNGLDLVRPFREISPGSRIVILSADGSAENKRRAFEEGASQFVEKPFEMTDLLAVLNGVFGKFSKKRAYERYLCRLPLRIMVISPSPEEASLDLRNLSATTVDLGDGGVRLRTAYTLRKGQRVLVSTFGREVPCTKFAPPGSTAEVVWVDNGRGECVAGLRAVPDPTPARTS